MSTKMTAELLARKYGDALVGRRVMTPAYGSWAGGVCVVTELRPDRNAPEIVFNVRRESDGEEIGVFNIEPVDVVAL